MTAIQTLKLTKNYDKQTVVDCLDLAVNQGELFSLLGVNGAGKTTTIKMLSCLISPTNGDAILLGNSILSNVRPIKEKINISPQETAVAPNLSVKENLELISRIYGFDKKTTAMKITEMVTAFNLNAVSSKKAKTLSGGTQRRLSIAMSLISDPQILFLDEPTLGLDVIARRELWTTIEKLKGKVTIILTTHYLEEAEALSDKIGIMVNGKLKAIGTAAEMIEKAQTKTFEDAFVTLATGS